MAVTSKSTIRMAIAAGLALSACTANANQESYPMDGEITCVLEDDSNAGASSAEICEAFVGVLREAGRDDVARVVLSAPRSTEAEAVAISHSGETLAEMGYSIMDRELALDSWKDLAGSLVRQLEK